MALAGLRPIHVHIRMDFLMLAMNQLVNVAAKSRYMYGGRVSVPLVVRSMIGKSWGQGAQHSQGLYSFFMHIPGLKVVAPTTPYDAKGCLIAAIRDDNPVLYVEHRMLHFQNGPVPEDAYTVPPGKARVTAPRRGRDAGRHLAHADRNACAPGAIWKRSASQAEVIDPDLAQPARYRHHRRIGARRPAACSWSITAGLTCGAGAEIVARVAERLQGGATVRVGRLGFAPVTCPTTPGLEDLFYPNARTIAAAACDLVEGRETGWLPEERPGPATASNSRGRFDATAHATRHRKAGLDWPLMKNNITRDDLDAVIDFLRQDDPDPDPIAQRPGLRARMVGLARRPPQRVRQLRLVGQPADAGRAQGTARRRRGHRADR